MLFHERDYFIPISLLTEDRFLVSVDILRIKNLENVLEIFLVFLLVDIPEFVDKGEGLVQVNEAFLEVFSLSKQYFIPQILGELSKLDVLLLQFYVSFLVLIFKVVGHPEALELLPFQQRLGGVVRVGAGALV